MTKRDVVKTVLEHKRPPYISWHFGFTVEAKQKLMDHYDSEDIMDITDNHLLLLGRAGGYIFAPSHDVEGDVPLENILAFIEKAKNQDGYKY